MTIEDIYNTNNFVTGPADDVIIKVVGVGGGGNNAVSHMYEQGIRQVSFAVCNTDRQALNNSPVPTRVLLGPETTRGLGAGNIPERARQAAEESAQEIERLFDDQTRMVFITAGMGGGTGTGASPVVARIAREKGLLTIGIVTIPFLFEGRKKIVKAYQGAKDMSQYVDALLLVNNEMLTEIYPDLDWMNAFAKADDTLSNAARSISELITCDGKVNLDFNDVKTTLEDGGTAIISSGYGEGEHRVTKAIQDALHTPLLRNRDIYTAKRLLFNLYFSRKAENPCTMHEADELTAFISNMDDVDVIHGIGFDDSLGDKVKITILAAGFDATIMDDITFSPSDAAATGATSGQGFDRQSQPTRVRPGADTAPAAAASDSDRAKELMRSLYGDKKIQEQERAIEAARYIILRPDQFDNDDAIEALEHTPTFARDKRLAEPASRPQTTAAPATASSPEITSTSADSPSHEASAGSGRKIVF